MSPGLSQAAQQSNRGLGVSPEGPSAAWEPRSGLTRRNPGFQPTTGSRRLEPDLFSEYARLCAVANATGVA